MTFNWRCERCHTSGTVVRDLPAASLWTLILDAHRAESPQCWEHSISQAAVVVPEDAANHEADKRVASEPEGR